MEVHESQDDFTVIMKFEQPFTWKCVETVTVSDYLRNQTKFVLFEKKSTFRFSKREMQQKEINFIRKKGFFIYFLCGNIYEVPMSIYKTLKAIVGGMGLYKYMPIFGSKILDYQS